jgi:hypothetical protein
MIIVGSWEDSEELLEVFRISIVAEWVKEIVKKSREHDELEKRLNKDKPYLDFCSIAREECGKKGNKQNKKFGGDDE